MDRMEADCHAIAGVLVITASPAVWRWRRLFLTHGVAVLNLDPHDTPSDLARKLAVAAPDLVFLIGINASRHLPDLRAAFRLAPLPEHGCCLVRAGCRSWLRIGHPGLDERLAAAAPESDRALVTDAIVLVRFLQMLRHYTAPAADLAGLQAWFHEASPTAPVVFGTRRLLAGCESPSTTSGAGCVPWASRPVAHTAVRSASTCHGVSSRPCGSGTAFAPP